MNGNESFEGLNFVSKDRLDSQATPEGNGRVVVPGINDAFYVHISEVLLVLRKVVTYS